MTTIITTITMARADRTRSMSKEVCNLLTNKTKQNNNNDTGSVNQDEENKDNGKIFSCFMLVFRKKADPLPPLPHT